MYYTIKKIKLKNINKSKKTSIYKSLFKPFGFCSREYDVTTPISKSPITFRWKQVIQYMTSVTSDSVEQITIPILYYIRYQNDLICIAKTIGSPNEGVNQI